MNADLQRRADLARKASELLRRPDLRMFMEPCADGSRAVIVALPDDTCASLLDRVAAVGGHASAVVPVPHVLGERLELLRFTVGEASDECTQDLHPDAPVAMLVDLLMVERTTPLHVKIAQPVLTASRILASAS